MHLSRSPFIAFAVTAMIATCQSESSKRGGRGAGGARQKCALELVSTLPPSKLHHKGLGLELRVER